jgi:transposase
MPFDPASLPRDPDRLIEIIITLQDRNAHLEGIVAALKRTVYGPRSEKLIVDTAQLPLDLDDVVLSEPPAVANDDAVGPQPARPSSSSRRKAARNIGALPKHLPRCEVVIEPESKICPCCGGTMHVIGEDVSELLDVIPAVLQVKRIRRPRYGCRSCEGAVVQAKAPPRLVENGMATTALVTAIVVGKFAWHLPLNRQTDMLRGQRIALDRSTLVHWVIRAAWWLKPLHGLLVDIVLGSPKVFCDDTPLPVLDRRRRRTRTARFWSYAIDDRPWQGPAPPAVVYLYAEDRKGQHVHEHLTGFSGVLQVDGYTGYRELTKPNRPGGAVTLAYCLAHARRQFFEVYRTSKSSVAAEALLWIQRVYEVEEQVRGLTVAERVAVRQAETKPILEAFGIWLMQRLAEESAKSKLADAIRYALNHWDGLTVFLTDGRVEVDSNVVERTIRPIALGRRNALFAGSTRGAEAWAILASIINTAKLHELDPQTYLADVLERIVSGQTKVNALHELLPWTWKATRAAQMGAAA